MENYCFDSLSGILERMEERRCRIVREARLPKKLVRRILRKRGINLAVAIEDLCERRRQIRSEVLVCLIELAGGLRPFTAWHFVERLGELIRRRLPHGVPPRRWQLKLLPPKESLKAEDPDLCARAQAFHDYCLDAVRLGQRFRDEVWAPSVRKERHQWWWKKSVARG